MADKDRYRLIRKQYEQAVEGLRDLPTKWTSDVKFTWIPGNQWDSEFGNLRGDRPKFEVNKLRQAVKQVTNDIRQNTPSIKVRAVEDGDTDLAEIRQGLIRNIESQSNADVAYDWAAMYAVSAGYGAIRVTTGYVDDVTFDQDIMIQRVHNALSVKFDPNAKELDKRDGMFAFVDDEITREEYKRRFKGKEPVAFNTDSAGDLAKWSKDKTVTIAEYWQRKLVKKELLLLSTGEVVDAEGFDEFAAANPPMDMMTGQMPEPVTVQARRSVDSYQVTMEIVDGEKTLEGPFDWPGKFIPLVPVWGDFIHVEGEDHWYGMARHSRDPVVLNNYAVSMVVETLDSQPNAPFLYTPTHVEGFEKQWREANRTNSFGLPYNPDPSTPGGRPTREQPPTIAPGFAQLMGIASDAIKATTGIYDASLGARSNETSGRAIIARDKAGDVANFDYTDNLHRAIRFVGEIVSDLIPSVYDAERVVRVLGEDGAAKFAKINEQVWDGEKYEIKNDMRKGRFDITISTGPSYTTQRMETAEAFMQLSQQQGPMGMLAQYGVLMSMDTPGMDEVKDGMRRVLIGQGLLKPGEKDEPPKPQPPNPKDQADAALKGEQAKKVAAETRQIDQETQMGMQWHAQSQGMSWNGPPPEPMPPFGPAPIQQPPNGGFFVPEEPGFPQ